MFTIGTDSEIPITDGKTYRSVIGLIRGTKDCPVLTSFGNIQEDNVLAEFAIDPCNNVDKWVTLINAAKNHLALLMEGHGFKLHINSCITLPDFELEEPMAWAFGCDPDYNAYTNRQNPKPEGMGPKRVAGGHIHVGHANAMGANQKRWLIKYMDMYLGLPSIVLDDTAESRERRQYYGKAGAFRPKPYGVEYRTLSNFWIADNDLIKWAYYQTEKAVQAFEAQPQYAGIDLRPVINTGDVGRARELIKEFNICNL